MGIAEWREIWRTVAQERLRWSAKEAGSKNQSYQHQLTTQQGSCERQRMQPLKRTEQRTAIFVSYALIPKAPPWCSVSRLPVFPFLSANNQPSPGNWSHHPVLYSLRHILFLLSHIFLQFLGLDLLDEQRVAVRRFLRQAWDLTLFLPLWLALPPLDALPGSERNLWDNECVVSAPTPIG